MKKHKILLAALVLWSGASPMAQTFHIGGNSINYNFSAESAGNMNFGAEKTLTIMGKQFTLSDDTKMWIDDAEVSDNVVSIVYTGATATVDIAGNIAKYVSASVDGAHVIIDQSSDLSASEGGEITYRLSGTSSDGSILLNGSFKCTIELNGLNLTSTVGAPFDIQCGKRIAVKLGAGTTNSLVDSSNGKQKGCVVAKGHLEFKGTGELTVAGNTSHAIYAKEYIEMANCKITVTSAKKDGLNCNQYFTQKSGILNIDGVEDDGIQVSFKDSADREEEDTGAITIKGGELTVKVKGDACKGAKCEGPMLISDGIINITASGNGIWDSTKNKTKAAACLGGDTIVTINGGTINLTATGGGGKGINCDHEFIFNGGNLNIVTTGGVCAYVNGSLNNNYTGNTDRLDSDMKSSPKGVKADGIVEINGGEITVKTTGNGGEGIESKSTLTINDGNIYIVSSDDCINSSSHMYVKGGNVTVISKSNDGLDSNGNLYIQGGYTMAFGASSPECGIDANEEGGFSVYFMGGTLLAVGGGNSVPTKTGTTQPYVSGSGSATANSVVSLTTSSGETLASFTIPTDYTSSGSGGGFRPGGGQGGSILITCPGLTNGTSYTLKNGSSSSSVSAKLTGSGGRF